jgi:hypothetical protein
MVDCAVIRERRNWASAWENHILGSLILEVWEFDGNVSDWGGNDGLGGQRGDDCRSDLGLQGGGLFRHPKNERKCGLELG